MRAARASGVAIAALLRRRAAVVGEGQVLGTLMLVLLLLLLLLVLVLLVPLVLLCARRRLPICGPLGAVCVAAAAAARIPGGRGRRRLGAEARAHADLLARLAARSPRPASRHLYGASGRGSRCCVAAAAPREWWACGAAHRKHCARAERGAVRRALTLSGSGLSAVWTPPGESLSS